MSQLVVERSQLALDSNGTLFRSDDQGKHWHPVHQQWDGKAVELLGIPPLTAAPGSGQAPDPTRSGTVCRRTSAQHDGIALGKRGSGQNLEAFYLDDVRRNDIKWSGTDAGQPGRLSWVTKRARSGAR